MRACVLFSLLLGLVPAAPAAETEVEHFEKEIRPLLAEHCYPCHSRQAPSAFAGLYFDSRANVFGEAERPAVVVPGDADASPLVRAILGETKQMPPAGKLDPELIARITAWVDAGAAWPKDAAGPSPSSSFDLESRRDAHWAWQPAEPVDPPQTTDQKWPRGPIDNFVLARLETEGLTPASGADRRTLIRRITLDLTGLTPTPTETAAFLNDRSPDAYERLVDRLLASPQFGERWARHWMDLFRYTESHGSEGDPRILEAWRYRDYLIRALNADIPYNQLIREHIAGDLLPQPRTDKASRRNESLLGTANLRMVEHSFQPVQPWEDRVKWTDNQIDVLSKAFLGLTVSCARCHDHKFDAISQEDYYALFGSVKGARPVQRAVDDPAYLQTNRAALVSLRDEIRAALAARWRPALPDLRARIEQGSFDGPWLEALCDPEHPLSLLQESRLGDGSLDTLQQRASRRIGRAKSYNSQGFDFAWTLPADTGDWLLHGTGLIDPAAPAGAFAISPSGNRAVDGIYPAGVYSHLVSSKHDAVAQSPRFKIESDYISVKLLGGDLSNARLMIENYPVPRGGIYHQRHAPKRDEPYWMTWKTAYWKGFTAYIELAQHKDLTNYVADPIDSKRKPRPKPDPEGRSHFGLMAVAFHDTEAAPRLESQALGHFLQGARAGSAEEFAAKTIRLLEAAIDAWVNGTMSDEQAAFLDAYVRPGLLPVSLQELDRVTSLVARYRALEADVPVARRAPGVLEEAPPPQALLIRGNHNQPGDPVARRFLTALGGAPCNDAATARLHLAEEIASADNPLTARVAVNRIWQKMFGAGLVATVDNFGKLGDTPSHPELLDYLAQRFVEEGWSTKWLVRELATTRAYQMASEASAEAAELDPRNRLLQHMPVRRLDAEAIRDTLLYVSGELDTRLYGPAIPVYYAFSPEQDKGADPPGPRDGELRRSIYQEIRRNAHNPFLEVFDVPPPASTRGQRDQTNVPGQSLTMLNSPFVRARADAWAAGLVARPDSAATDRVVHMYETLFARRPNAAESSRALALVDTLAGDGETLRDEAVWADLAHALFNLKEFLYVR